MKNNKTNELPILKARLGISQHKTEFLTQMNTIEKSEIKFVFFWLVLPKLVVLTYCIALMIFANNLNDKVGLMIIAGFLIIISQSHLNRISELYHAIRIRKLKIANEAEKQDEILANIHKINQQTQAEGGENATAN